MRRHRELGDVRRPHRRDNDTWRPVAVRLLTITGPASRSRSRVWRRSKSALTGFALNYANIIALPVLLGVGVAFKIYYVMAWRRGETNFLESALTRAPCCSARR
jgi:hypothetical protein